jgi:predicted CopG family antitoxin
LFVLLRIDPWSGAIYSLKEAFPELGFPEIPVEKSKIRLAPRKSLCMYLCMATKTLSVDEEAYRALVRARRQRGESFSQVIKRAKWEDGPKRCGTILDRVTGTISEEVLDRLVEAQKNDFPPVDKWNR